MGEIPAFCVLLEKIQLRETVLKRREGEIVGAQMECGIGRMALQRCPHSSPWNQLNILYYMAKGNLKIQLRLWILREGDCSGLSGCAPSHHMNHFYWSIVAFT